MGVRYEKCCVDIVYWVREISLGLKGVVIEIAWSCHVVYSRDDGIWGKCSSVNLKIECEGIKSNRNMFLYVYWKMQEF